jgi:anti-anti-sigma factor
MSEKHGSHWLEREDLGPITVVRLKTPKVLDEDTLRAVFDPIYTLTTIGRSKLVLNLDAVGYLPSLGLGKLVMLNRKVQVAKGWLALCQLSDTVRETLESTHLDSLFNIYATEEAAMQSFT